MLNEVEYDKKYEQYLNGTISEEEWKEYCLDCFDDILNDNKEVLVRLKY